MLPPQYHYRKVQSDTPATEEWMQYLEMKVKEDVVHALTLLQLDHVIVEWRVRIHDEEFDVPLIETVIHQLHTVHT